MLRASQCCVGVSNTTCLDSVLSRCKNLLSNVRSVSRCKSSSLDQYPAIRHIGVELGQIGRSRSYSGPANESLGAIDVIECPRCLGRMRILAAIHPPDAIRAILECLGLPSRAPPIASAAGRLSSHPDEPV